MEKLNFTKMAGAGNDFIMLDSKVKGEGFPSVSLGTGRVKNYCQLARKLCDRKNGIGADGMLVLEKSKIADFKMGIFNSDGSVAEMCGNGLRCAVLYVGEHQGAGKRIKVETKAGIYEGEITAKDRVKVRMQEPKDLRLNFSINVNGCKIKANFINTGVPHAVIFVEGLNKIDVDAAGELVRNHDEFNPKGANVNFVEIIDDNNINIRTYERGVEGETLACGTGAVASAIISRVKGERFPSASLGTGRVKTNVHTRSGILKVEFQKAGGKIKDVYLEGEARKVFAGQITL